MIVFRTLLRAFVVIAVATCPLNTSRAKDIEAETSVEPAASDNFYETGCRLWVSERTEGMRGALVLLGGTDSDSRGLANDAQWRNFASQNGVALIGCYFRGDGEAYEQASLGSGNALLQMIGDLADKTNCDELKRAPLMFVGYSAGAMFAYSFMRWKPERICAIVSIKSGPISADDDTAQKRSALIGDIPTLFIVGECDVPGRVRSVVGVFEKASPLLTPSGSPQVEHLWALAVEPDGDHGLTPADMEFARAYLEDISAANSVSGKGSRPINPNGSYCSLLNLSGRSPVSPHDPNTVWLPGPRSLEAWKAFTKPASVKELAENGGREEPPTFAATSLNFGEISKDRSPQRSIKSMHLEQRTPLGTAIKSFTVRLPSDGDWSFSSADPQISVAATKRSAGEYELTLTLATAKLKSGWYRSCIGAVANSQQVSLPVIAKIAGAISADPPSLYLGVMPRGQIVEKLVTLRPSGERPLKIRNISSTKAEFAEARIKQNDDTSVTLQCRFDGTKEMGNQSGFFDISYGDSENEEIRIPFIAWVSKHTAERKKLTIDGR